MTQSLTAQIDSLSARQDIEAQKAAEASIKAAETRRAVAALFDEGLASASDAQKAAAVLPNLIHVQKLYGIAACFAFPATTADVILNMLSIFPPAKTYRVKRTFLSFMPECHKLEEELAHGAESVALDGPRIDVNRLPDYETQMKVIWVSEVNGTLVEFSMDWKYDREATPMLDFEATRAFGHGKVIRVTNDWLKIPKGLSQAQIREVTYSSAGADYIRNRVIYSVHQLNEPDRVPATTHLLQLSDQILQARRRALIEAYEQAKLNPQPEGVQARTVGLNPGTKEQQDCLDTLEARTQAWLCKNHFWAYCLEHGMKRTSGYYLHYDWACYYLETKGLLTVEHNGQPYKYGTAWL